MRPVSIAAFLVTLAGSASLAGCNGCGSKSSLTDSERNQLLASAIATPAPSASAAPPTDSIGHAANVIPGQGPKRIEFKSDGPRLGPAFPILPGQGVGPIRFGANRKTIERLEGAPCDDATETLCRYVGRGLDFKLDGGVTTEIRISRKGREAKRAADGSIIEYGFYNGAILPDLYFGMQPGALQEVIGAPQKVEKVTPMGPDGFAERHFYDGMVLEYDQWSNGKLVLGAAVLTKSDTAAAANDKAIAERERKAKLTPPTKVPR